MIDLGLKRISQLVHPSTLPWKAIHVAGTNGKGSVCAYLTSALHASGIRVGRFTSPHLIHRWDCITLHNVPVARSAFLAAEAHIHALNAAHKINATEFELLTATAFELFSRSNVQIAIVEVGLGGLGDATNVLAPSNILAAVVTKLGIDHQGFLGDTIEEISAVKAGIAKSGRPLVVDATNLPAALDTVQRVAAAAGALPIVLSAAPEMVDGAVVITTPAFGRLRFETLLPGAYQPHNLSCAITALSLLAPQLPAVTPSTILAGVAATRWPGRLETVDISALVPNTSVLVDGAHNPQAQRELRAYVDVHVRRGRRVYWVLAATRGKDVEGMVRELVAEGDVVVGARFGEVDGMPWVSAVGADEIVDAAGGGVVGGECVDAVRLAAGRAREEGAVCVVAGSLYLVADLHRFLEGVRE